jgi:transcriptional regulator with XRE-family HTH domain
MPELLNKELMRFRLKELFDGKSTKEVAEEIGGVSQQSVSYYLNGGRSPKVEFLSKVADQYGVNIQWLIGIPDAPKYLDTPEAGPDEDVVILSRAAKKMSPEDRKKLIEMAKVMFNEAFED